MPKPSKRLPPRGLRISHLQGVPERDALAALRVATDVMIYMPVSDALSATVLETIYAGNVLVAGALASVRSVSASWASFVEAEDYDQLFRLIPPLLDHTRVSGSELDDLQTRIEKEFLADGTVPAWIDIVLNLTQQSQRKFRLTMSSTLRSQVARGVGWSAADQVFQQVHGVLSLFVLARLLLPADYGTLGMVTVFHRLCCIFADLGLSRALCISKM